MLGRGSTAVMGMGMWLKRYRYAAGEKRRKPFKEIFSGQLGNLLEAVPEFPSVVVF